MKQATLCFLIKENEICLAMKKRGFGAGKWNGVGGKPKSGETLIETSTRETYEEIGVTTYSKDLQNVAIIQFYYIDKPDWDVEVHVFITNKWRGTPTETDEMAPKWYLTDNIPYKNMWIDDVHWLPLILNGEKVEATFHLSNKGNKLDSFIINTVPHLT